MHAFFNFNWGGRAIWADAANRRRSAGVCKRLYRIVFKTLPQYSSESVCMIWMTSKLASR